ncbi:MAG: molybdenum cofactor guanylyltransferase [Prolixibacteraceae bacterium]|nr:molybdenum cofactor guanylyltransferase [Prolixibacteraceae bacterium]
MKRKSSGKVTGIILAGGKSSRFGCDKAHYPYGGKRLIDYAIEVIKPVCDEIIIGTNDPEKYLFHGIQTVSDIYSGCGPMGGMHACLLHSQNMHNIIIGCDMPGLKPELFRFILEHKSGSQVVVPVHKGLKETLAGYYHKSILAVLEKALGNKQYKIIDVLPPHRTLCLNVEDMPFYSENLFVNINTKGEMDQLKKSGSCRCI